MFQCQIKSSNLTKNEIQNYNLKIDLNTCHSILEFLKNFIESVDGIPVEFQKWNFHQDNEKEILNYIDENMNSTFPAQFTVTIPLAGGKGGFGSMLRAEGKKNLGKKTTNFESSRDLSGRRLRSVNEAQKLAEYIAQAPERKKAEKELLEEKLKKVEKKLENNVSVVKVDNSVFLKEKETVLESMEDAIDSALKKASSSSFKITKLEQKKKPVTKKASAWRTSDDSD